VAKECGIISPGETVVEVTATAKIKDSPAEIFYTSSKGVSLFTISFMRASICGSWHKITSSCLTVGGRVLPTFYPGNEYFGHPPGFHLYFLCGFQTLFRKMLGCYVKHAANSYFCVSFNHIITPLDSDPSTSIAVVKCHLNCLVQNVL